MASVTPAAVLKRKRDDQCCDYTLCLICQLTTEEHLRSGSDPGKERIRNVISERTKWNDSEYVTELGRLQNITEHDWINSEMKWHKDCYSNFTSNQKLERLRKNHIAKTHAKTDTKEEQRQTRSSTCPVDWNLCIFCQSTNVTDMHNVETPGLSARVIATSKHDLVMNVRMSGVEDLIAAEGKYHLKCLAGFDRRHAKRISTSHTERHDIDAVMDELGKQLLQGLAHGNVYNMKAVFEKYISMCAETGIEPPARYVSRRKTFTESIRKRVGIKANFIRPLNMTSSLLIYPSDKSEFFIAKTLTSMTEDDEIPEELFEGGVRTDSNIIQDIVHTGLQIRKDLAETSGHSGVWQGINRTSVKKVVPASLYLLLSVMCGGTSVLDSDDLDDAFETVLFSIAQDISYAASKSKKLTPKHVGLGLTLHQATRSEELVNLFHAAGHCIGIDTVRRIDTTIANGILDEYERNECVYIPTDIVPYEHGRLILSSCDNIDVLEETIDGKNTFHCTQMVTWQRGPPLQRTQCDNDINRERSLNRDRLKKIHEIDHANVPKDTKPTPRFHEECQIDPETWFTESEERKEAKLINEAWLLSRMTDDEEKVPPWTAFNAVISEVDPPITTVGMLPILQAPADDNDTMTTVINRFVSISNKLGQKHTILVADQPLYSRAKSLLWAHPTVYMNVVVLLGDLHILFNFLKAIGQHLESSGLVDIWVESGLFAEKSTDAMMNGKAYYRAVQGHVWTYEALNRIWWSKFGEWLSAELGELMSPVHQQVRKVVECFESRGAGTHDAVSELVSARVLADPELQRQKNQFNRQLETEPNNKFWKNYMDMVEILLDFIRANRDGNWKLHLDAFTAMLPWLTIYDHTNYARWGPVYLADMHALPVTAPEVHAEFMAGNFVVKRSDKRFNQVPVDQATEWINRMCKISNGIIGITRNDSARDRFCVTWAERSHVSHDTKSLFALLDDDDVQHNVFARKEENARSTHRYDSSAVRNMMGMFQRFNMFKVGLTTLNDELRPEPARGTDEHADCSESHVEGIVVDPETAVSPLISLTSNDVVTDAIQADLLTAGQRGVERVLSNVNERLIEKSVQFFDPIKRNYSKTFASLYNCTTVNQRNEKKLVKADRKLIQKLLTATQAGRNVQTNEILKHELSPVPLSLAKVDGEMNSTAKSDLLGILTTDVDIETSPTSDPQEGQRCIIIDGHALVQALGKPASCSTFNDYAGLFARLVLRKLTGSVKRVDVVFDRYIGDKSIKTVTRAKRSGKKKRPIRKIIDNGTVPLPKSWSQYITLDENKAELAHFLSSRLIEYGARLEQEYAGGFEDPCITKSSRQNCTTRLEADHEEADTRIILHAADAIASGFSTILVECRDTDVLLMMIHFLGPLDAEVWMVGGTSKQRKYYPVTEIYGNLSKPVVKNILGFHALTGCDSTSSFTGHGKKTGWKVFKDFPELLRGLGRDGPIAPVEEFVCRLYGAARPMEGVDQARNDMFQKGKKTLEMLPPTKDALQLHVYRANHQAKIWLHADIPQMDIASPLDTGGWKRGLEGTEIIWSSLPSVPSACIELISCGCTTKCKMASCKCNKSGQVCTPACACNADKCRNPVGL